jgi:hypothetical protein
MPEPNELPNPPITGPGPLSGPNGPFPPNPTGGTPSEVEQSGDEDE